MLALSEPRRMEKMYRVGLGQIPSSVRIYDLADFVKSHRVERHSRQDVLLQTESWDEFTEEVRADVLEFHVQCICVHDVISPMLHQRTIRRNLHHVRLNNLVDD